MDDNTHLVINCATGASVRLETEFEVADLLEQEREHPTSPPTRVSVAEQLVAILTEAPDFETAKKDMVTWLAAQKPLIELK